MTERYISYSLDGDMYDVPESESETFEKRNPAATIEMRIGKDVFDVPLSEKENFLKINGNNASYLWEDKQDNEETNDKTTVFETIGKGLGAAGVGTAKLAVDLARITGGAIEAIGDKTLDEVLKDQNRPLANISNKLGDVQERLSREADPTAGQQGYLELLKEGKIGKLAQKALGSGLESLPMMVAAGTGWGALLYGAGMAAEQYVDETEDGSNVDPWKRAINAIGSSALELAVERIGGPLKNIGKAGKEISEEAAKEILEVAVKEGTENVAKRITKKLLKEGGEEGVEELATSAGTDALGQALDWIDGNSDYGLEAQWNQYKEQNPDASKSDFAKAKAEEYMDAFIGGAVSGMEISGTVEGANRGLRKLNGETGDIMKSARDYGASMDYGDMYDTDADVATAKADLAKLFTNKNGEQTVSNEFIDTLSAEDAYALSERDDFSRDQRRAFGQLAVAKATQDGLNQKLDENLEANIAATRERIEGVTENGTVTTGMLNGRVVYVKGGIAKNGSVSISEDGANGPVIVVDSVTGEETTANSSDITSASSVDSATLIGDIESSFREKELNNRNAARNTMSIKAKLSAIQSLEGKKVMIDLGNGLAEVNIQQILPQSGEVLIKGKKGDLGGQSNVKIGADVFYDAISRDDNGNPIVTDGDIEVEDEAPDVAQTEVAVEDDFRGEVATILINGVPVDVEVISQDNPSDTIVYEYTDENGNTKRGRTTIGGFKDAIQQTAETPAIPEEPVAETPVAEEPVPVEEAPAAEETPVEETPLNPESIDWDALFEQDPEAYFVELQNQFGEETLDILNEEIDAAQGELDALAKAKTKSQNERLENRKKKASLQKRIEILNGMVARLTPAQDVAAETPVEDTPETPADVTPEFPVEEPTPVEEAPTAETPVEEGFIFKDGVVTNPLVIEMPGEEGTTNKILLAEKDGKWGSASYAVLDDGNESGTPPIQIQTLKYDTKEEAIAAALKYFDFYKGLKKKSPSTKLDAFIQYIKDTYLKSSEEPAVVPAEPQPTTPVAPNPVDNPIREAQKKEKSLATQLKRYDLTHELKQDLAFKAGKAVADFFATREEYEAYAENATDLGEYNEDFERGVDESFANRPQNTGNSPVNSVPLGTEPKGENNGEQGEEDGTSGNGPSVPDNSGRTTDGGTEGGDQTSPKVGKGKANKGKAGNKVADKYPARKGNATQKLLVDTFGFNKVEIPNSRKETLNTIYDFMMAMSKMLGISPKSIGQGGWLDVGSLRSNAKASAEHSLISKSIDQSVVKATLKYKYGRLKGLAHEWWHALDHALSYFETGKGKIVASEIPGSRFTGRQETWYAVNQVIKAIKDSGHESRMFALKFPRRYVDYLVEPTEMAARAFDEYIKAKFAAAGIIIENSEDTDFVAQPTAEEMAVITPAFDNLFNVLQEKEGKTPGTSVLFHIGEMMEPESEAKVFATDAVALALGENSGINLHAATDEDVAQMMDAAGADTKAELMVASDRPVFVSNAAIAVEAINQEKATPEQWLKMIEKNGGLKAGEDKWMGLSDWLKASDKKTLTKQEVLDFIKENTIQIEEVNYGEIDFIKEDKKQTDAIQKEFDEIANSFMDQGYTIKHSYFLAFDKMKDKYGDDFSLAFDMYDGVLFVNNRDAASSITGIEYSEKGINETRLGYTTNGLTNLKEIAIVVPTIEAWNEGDEIHFGDAGDGRTVAWVRFGETSAIVEDANYVRLQEIYDRLNELESKVASEGITMEEYEERERLREERDSIPESRSQRVLVIDEIQSKRHQEGREYGYKVSREKADAEMEKFMDQMHSKYEFTSSTPFVEVFNEDEMREYARLYMQQHRATFGTTNIPDAPFDKNWHELAMKRMLRYAAENGYDAIAWTKGAQQAERYDIGQSVKTIEKGREYDNGTRYTLYDNSDTGRSIFVKDGIVTDAYFDELQGKPLSEAVGKEIADAMLSMEEGEIKDTKGMIGGEGMKGFYDKILPAFMNKYGKKWGVKVSDISLPFVESAGRVMHSVPVTQSMKDSVLEGQPMFMKRPNGIVYGWAIDNNIYYTKAGFNPNTLTHEYTHLWAKAMMQKNPKGWKSVKDLLRGTPVWNEVMNDTNYSNIHSNEDSVASEVLARISGSENAAKMEQMAQQMIDEAKGTARKLEARGLIQRIKDALNEFWSWVGVELFGIEKFESVEQVADRVLWDLMNKTDLELSKKEDGEILSRREQYKSIPSEEYSVLSSNLSQRYGNNNVYGCIGYTSNYFYICDYIDGETLVKKAIEIEADEDTIQYIENYARRGDRFTAESFVAGIDSSRARVSGEVWDSNGSQNEGSSMGDGMVDSTESGTPTESERDNGSVSEDNWITVKTGYDGSKFARIRFVDDYELDFLSRRSDIQNAAVDFLAGEPRLRVIENAVNEEAAKLGVSVTYKTRSEMPEGHKNDKGYYNTKTGEIVICTENASSIADAIQTILHEAVAHKGLRQLMGDKFNEFITRVYESLDAEIKAKVDALAAEHYDGNTAIATEEYMASLAETEDFANNSLWDKIKSIFEDIINAILGRNDIKIGDNELRYILRASYNNMVNPRGMESMRVWAQDQMMREEYKINQASPEILSRTGIDPTEVSRESAKAVYDKMVADRWNEFQRQFQDAMQPVRIAIDAIQQETGNLPIEDYENFILTQNQASSRSRVEMDIFARNYYSPIVEQVNNVIDVILEARGYDKKNRKKRSEVYAEIRQYLIAKHGLERNEYYQSTKTRKLTAWEKTKETDAVQKEYNEKVNLINTDTTLTDAERELQLRDALDELNAAIDEINTREVPDLRDYSGLTALFGMDPKKFREAEAEAQQLVDKFEAEAGSVTEEMWKKINAATDKTLRHSYESGMISRQQYNDIKAMFKFYIPLRGFDETTAEDVYSYARFEGNRFNPAVQSAGGRTSLADDPLAIIMNMAESEIAQGNKNRAKQALYNFILNRPLTDSQGNQVQNSLMQIENVWYIKNTDSDGNEIYTIAVPNHESGETYEEFENRMQALAAEDKAYKSKKGKVDVGMRFQKQQNRDAHYVYLKVNGVDKAIYINGDPKAADAINGVYGKPKGELAEKMGTLNRFISSTFTNYSLEFTARNYFRDMFYSHINIDVKEKDPAYRKKFRQNWRHNNLGTMMRMLKAYRAGEFDGRPLNEDEAAFVEFMANGGQTGYTVINSVENHKAELERAIKNMQNGIEKGGIKDSTVFKYTLGSIELLNEASELVTRFAAFKTSRDMGRGVETSINDAKEITVNFNTKGAQDGKGLFGAIAGYFGWSKFFFNASVQGVQNIKAMAEANKLKFCSTVGGVAAIGFLMPVFTSVIAQILGGDDDEYWNIPEYDRQNNFCIPLGNGKYAKIPLPIGFREVYAIGDMVAAMAWDKKFTRDFGQVGTDIANKIASVVLPINPLESAANGLSLWHTLLYTALPSSVQFAIQNATNIDWKGAPLQKEYTYNEDDPKWMKAFNSNPSWMVGLSKWCNEHIGSGDMKGWDWSPEKLDNTLSSVFGGVYNLVKKTGRSISMIWNEENRNLSNIPLSGVVLGSGIESDDRFMTDAYYDMNEYYDQRIGFIKRRAKTFGYSLEDVFEKKKGRHHPKMQEIYGNSEFEWMREWYFGNKDLDKLNDKIKKLKKEIEAKENPTQDKLNRLSRLMNEFEDERRDFVNDMLELD